MHRCIFVFLVFLLQTIFPCSVSSQKSDYGLFNNINPGIENAVVSCFLQDTQGLIWFGTNKGLFSYDGYSTQPHFMFRERSNTYIYCGTVADSTYLYLGADNGLLIYNYRTDRYEDVDVNFPTDIRTMVLLDGLLYLGTLNGLYTYHPKTHQLSAIKKGLPHQTIYSLTYASDCHLYVGTYNGCCRYLPAEHRFESIPLPVTNGRSNMFVNSLLDDPSHRCVWIGTEGCLYKYTPSDGSTQVIDDFRNNSVKSLALDQYGQLLVGTDNGLYVYREGFPLRHVVHDSRNAQSLANNIIWNIYADREQNIWLGTDYGISMSRHNHLLKFIPISQITGTGDGNRFYSMLRDARGNYWFGGTNGLIRFALSRERLSEGNVEEAVCDRAWYKMGDKTFPLSHNRVRHLYEDRDRQLWVTTDGGINRYDAKTHRFIAYNIVDSTHRYNANWAYGIFEDHSSRLWISTCLGGIFVVDKQKLMASSGKYYVAEKTYSVHNGLAGMFVNQMVADHRGNMWVLYYGSNVIEKINIRTGRISRVVPKGLSADKIPNYVLCAENGDIWMGYPGGLLRISDSTGEMSVMKFDVYAHYDILSMVEAEGKIWTSTTDGFWVVDEHTLTMHRLNIAGERFTSLFFDSETRELYLGMADGFAVSSPEALLAKQAEQPLLLTAFYVNGQLHNPEVEQESQSIRCTGRITLEYNQNNLSFELSDLPYSLDEKSRIIYRVEGIDQDWNLLPPSVNRITYHNLKYGDYTLTASKLDVYGKPEHRSYQLHISILPPWYYTWWAKTAYVLLGFVLLGWTVNFFRVKNRLKQEHEEKEKILEQSRAKMEFFTNLSHDLKMPLSMIVAPVSRMLSEIKSLGERKELEQVQRNAMKLNALIHQGLDFNRIDSGSDALLIVSQIELVSFTRDLLTLYTEEGMKTGKQLTYDFHTNRERVYIQMDAIKLESVLDNLLSNAVKYTPEGGVITLSLDASEEGEEMHITVTDTGVGIPEQDQPYVFQRFFQSHKTPGKKEGTGIGLYLVKTYTELHGGSVSLSSRENVGTTVTLTLPVVTREPDALPEKQQAPMLSYDEKFLENATRLIEEHISDSELNVNALCEWTFTNNKQMYRKIKQLTGMTPVEYIKSIRMKKAAMLLRQQKFTVAEVMYMVGFSNHSYFSKCFQAEFGVTPKAYS